MENKKQRSLTIVLSIVYFCLLIWILLFKMSFSLNDLYQDRSINIIPFAGSVIINGRLYITEIIDNILVFVPIGIYTCMLKQEWSILKKVSVAFFISLGIEVLQYILAIGSTDITDLIGNTIGGILGVLIFNLFSKIFKSKTINIINILAAIATVCLVSFLSILLLLN